MIYYFYSNNSKISEEPEELNTIWQSPANNLSPYSNVSPSSRFIIFLSATNTTPSIHPAPRINVTFESFELNFH